MVNASVEPGITPSALQISKRVRCSASDLANYAIGEAPKAASTELETNMMPTLARRIRKYWKEAKIQL